MLIATFRPDTPWQGTRITRVDGGLMLEGHGPIKALDVMEYDRQGYLEWADDGTRAWVGSQAAGGAGDSPDQDKSARLKRVLVWVIVALLVANAVLLVVAAHAVHVF